MSNEPQAIEPVPVQLTRIEGSVNLILYQLGDLKGTVERHEVDITALKLSQAASTGSSQSWKTWLPTILTALGVLAALGFGVHLGG